MPLLVVSAEASDLSETFEICGGSKYLEVFECCGVSSLGSMAAALAFSAKKPKLVKNARATVIDLLSSMVDETCSRCCWNS